MSNHKLSVAPKWITLQAVSFILYNTDTAYSKPLWYTHTCIYWFCASVKSLKSHAWYIIKSIFFMKFSHFNEIDIPRSWLHISKLWMHICTIEQNVCVLIFNWEFLNILWTKSTLGNIMFHSVTSQCDSHFCDNTWCISTNNLLIMLCFTVFMKHFMVCQQMKVFRIEEIKETRKFNFLW